MAQGTVETYLPRLYYLEQTMLLKKLVLKTLIIQDGFMLLKQL